VIGIKTYANTRLAAKNFLSNSFNELYRIIKSDIRNLR